MASRPFYVIAHMCNTPDDVEAALKAGANAIECDIDVDKNGNPYVHHPYPSEKPLEDKSTPLSEYFTRLRGFMSQYPKLALAIFDCKFDREKWPGMASLLQRVRSELTAGVGSSLNVLFTVAELKDADVFFPAKVELAALPLKDREGIGIDYENSPESVAKFFADRGATNSCYANGISFSPLGPRVRSSVSRAIADLYGSKLVYVWTVHREDQMCDYLRMGVDGIMVDDVEALASILQGNEFKDTVRLASRDESAFQIEHFPAYQITIRTGDRWGAGTDANVKIQLTGSVGETPWLLLSTPDEDDFERAAQDTFVVTSDDVGDLSQVSLQQDTAHAASDWYVDWVQVRRYNRVWQTYCDVWLDDAAPSRSFQCQAALTGPERWLLQYSDKATGRPWGEATYMAQRGKDHQPWDENCSVETYEDGYKAMCAVRDTLEKVIGAAGRVADKGYVYICGWRFNCLRDLSTNNRWLTGPWNAGERGALLDQTAIGLVLRLMQKGVRVRLLLWLPNKVGEEHFGYKAHVLDHMYAARLVQEESKRLQEQGVGEHLGVVALDMRTANHMSASHHQKMVVVRSGDFHEAFVGGVDLAFTRRDAPGSFHGDWQSGERIPIASEGWPWQQADVSYASLSKVSPPKVQQRTDLAPAVYDLTYQRWHDQYLKLQGAAVQTLEWQFVERWRDVGRAYTLSEPRNWLPGQVMFTDSLAVAGQNVYPLLLPDPTAIPAGAAGKSTVQMWRTIPLRKDRQQPGTAPLFRYGEFTVVAGIARAVDAAEQLIWIFDQYLWSQAFARHVNARLKVAPTLHVIVVLPAHSDDAGLLATIQHEATYRALQALTEDVENRVGIFALWDKGKTPGVNPGGIYVHAKSHTYDGELLVCGSANLNRRSFLCDTELACAVLDSDVVLGAPQETAAVATRKPSRPNPLPRSDVELAGRDTVDGRKRLLQRLPRCG